MSETTQAPQVPPTPVKSTKSITGFFKKLANPPWTLGTDIVNKLIETVSRIYNSIVDAIGTIFEALVSLIVKFLKIFEAVFQGISNQLQNPKGSITYSILAVIAIDLILGGGIGAINFVVKQAVILIGALKGLIVAEPLSATIVIVAFVLGPVLWKHGKIGK